MTVDMSPQAVATRLKRVSQLRRLCLSLKQTAKLGGKAETPEKEHEKPDKNESERDDVDPQPNINNHRAHATGS